MQGTDYKFLDYWLRFYRKNFLIKKALKLQKPNISTGFFPCVLCYPEQHKIAILGKEWPNMAISHSLT